MAAIEDMHDDEIRARLGLRPGPVPENFSQLLEQRIEQIAVASMPEPFDPETDAELEILDLLEGDQ